MSSSRKPRCFFSPVPLTHAGQVLTLSPDETRHLKVTLRLQSGDEIRLTDGRGHEGIAAIQGFDGPSAQVCLRQLSIPKDPASGGSRPLRLFVAYAAKGVMDEIIEKCQELGVAAVVPLYTERTTIHLSGEKEEKVLERWYKIAREASKQSGNPQLIEISPPCRLDAALEHLEAEDEVLFFHPGAKAAGLGPWLEGAGKVSGRINLWIGPEGGFTKDEMDKVRRMAEIKKIPFARIAFEGGILRMATAVVAAVAAVKYTQRN